MLFRSQSQHLACGQCAGQRGAVQLAWRSPNAEVLGLGINPASPQRGNLSGAASTNDDPWPARLLVFGMLGVALGAFQWSASPWFVATKQAVAEWLVRREIWWALDTPGQWWLFTHYPEVNDAFTWLDGSLLLAYIAVQALVLGVWMRVFLGLAAGCARLPWTRVAMTLIPLGGISVFVGLSQLTTTQLAGEGIVLPWAAPARFTLLLATLWAVALAWRLPGGGWRGVRTAVAVALAATLPLLAWHQQFFVW